MSTVHAVVSVIGRDQKGVVARFATYLAERGINIKDVVQQVVHGQFIMDMLVDLAEMSASLDELIEHDRTGCLTAPNDVVELADAMIRLWRRPWRVDPDMLTSHPTWREMTSSIAANRLVELAAL